ncbi:MAG: hypothetical protein ABIE94_05445, partial [archaeon]
MNGFKGAEVVKSLYDHLCYDNGNLAVFFDNSTSDIAGFLMGLAREDAPQESILAYNLDTISPGYSENPPSTRDPITTMSADMEARLKKSITTKRGDTTNVVLYIIKLVDGESGFRTQIRDMAQDAGIRIGGIPNCTLSLLQDV